MRTFKATFTWLWLNLLFAVACTSMLFPNLCVAGPNIQITDIISAKIQGESLELVTPSGPLTVHLLKIPAGTMLFHWADPYFYKQWKSPINAVTPSDMEHATSAIGTPNTGARVAGTGVYFSTDPIDARNYGDLLFAEKTPRDFWLIEENAGFFPVTKEAVQRINAALSPLSVVGSKTSGTWLTIIDTAAASDIARMNVKTVLDYSGPNASRGRVNEIVRGLFDKGFAMMPHPLLEKYWPALNHALEGKPLSPEEEEKVLNFFYYGLYKGNGNPLIVGRTGQAILAAMPPERREEFLLRLIPPDDPKALTLLTEAEVGAHILPDLKRLATLYPRINAVLNGASPTASELTTAKIYKNWPGKENPSEFETFMDQIFVGAQLKVSVEAKAVLPCSSSFEAIRAP